uniref:disease resistance protein Roq1-like n=1 Tax=Erigeron canadensis TaxID=72917 RepID=UPI001CB9C158|nr:disease resistance protein Roq1-like [Erigeron canadensis]
MSSSMSSSSVIGRKGGWTYDVFLSFRGEDTRYNFVDHLFAALDQKGIHTFKDDKMLGGGQPISEELVKAIKESRWAIVVFSKNYANSSWCLEELSNIMDCQDQLGQKVLPVFYHVDPSDVRGQKRDFATAFETHQDRGESAFITKIVEEILADRQPRVGSRENHLIDIRPRIDALISLLKMEATEEVRIVGIWGMGGLGKTTIARALFNRIAHKFQGSSFVTDVRENSSSKKDMCTLQERILSNILGEGHGYKIDDYDQGAQIIQERCCRKKVLLVLDDVNDVKQLEFLAATSEWFGPGSRIIITTRDQHLLSYVNADEKYIPPLLHRDQALELFSRHAFRMSSPPDGYIELTNCAINYTHGLPLALKVLGSFLCGREASVWGSALDTLAKTPSGEVLDTLKLSFDYLKVFEKQIFLDIACFYKGEYVDDVTRILDSFGFDPVIGISVLVEKSLITVSSNNKLNMHDLIQEMGRKIVQTSAPNSRLWELKKIHDLINSKELELVEGIVIPWSYWNCDVDLKQSLSANAFKSMKNLRVLDCYRKFTFRKPTFLPDKLRWFRWREYPFSSVPVTHMSKLVGLEMVKGKIKHLWKGEKVYSTLKPNYYLASEVSLYKNQNLKFINLQWCESLKRFPDVSGAPNIERLDLSKCGNLVEVDESVGSLKKLLYWDMTDCYELKCLPSMLHMESLETLILHSCWSLKRIPEFSPSMTNLSKLNIYNCREVEEVPSSITYLANLSYLNLDLCGIKNIPNSIWELKCLNTLGLSYCKIVGKLPHDFQSPKELHIDSIHIHSLINSCYLRKLELRGDLGDKDFPKNLHGLSLLEELHIWSNNKLIQLPESISHLSSLKHLVIVFSELQTLHGLPPGIQVLTLNYCTALEIEDLLKEIKYLNKIHISYCPQLLEDGRNLDKMFDQSFLKKCAAVDGCLSIMVPGRHIPSWFIEQRDGCKIGLKLPPKWQTEIIGFALCCVSTINIQELSINLRFENDEALFSKSEANNINETVQAGKYLWTGYIPYSLFEQFHGDNDNDFEGEDWFHMTQGNLVFRISQYYSGEIVRCGAKVVYKEEVTSIQQTIPSISSFYWSWKLTKDGFTNSFNCSWV